MTFGERVSAPGFQIKFEGSRPIFQLEGYVGFHFPRPVFRRVWDASGIVYGETLAQVACTADVPFIRMADAAQNVSVEHNQACCVVFGLVANIKVLVCRGFRPPSLKLRRTPSFPLAPLGYVWHAIHSLVPHWVCGTPSAAWSRQAKDGTPYAAWSRIGFVARHP